MSEPPTSHIRHRPCRGTGARRLAVLGALLGMLPALLWAQSRQSGPLPGGRVVALAGPPAHVFDGDTFAADLDGDGRIEAPREHVRLLYVDTPELSESWKGRDVAHGRPATRFLARALARGPLRLYLPPAGADRGNYGRTLAVVVAGEGAAAVNVNLALVRAGHSPFDTRFAYPPDYDRYAAAEGEAFDARRGIWADAPSRKRYLERLRREGRTPAGATNPAFVPGLQDVRRFDPAALLGRYVRIRGRLASRRTLSKGVILLRFVRERGRAPFPAVVFPGVAAKLDGARWSQGQVLRAEGFLHRYRGQPELVVHYAAPGG